MSATQAPPTPKEKARNDLGTSLREGPQSIDDCQNFCERTHKVLKKYPEFARETFVDSLGLERFPLAYLVCAKAPLALVEEVHYLNPEAVKTSDSNGFLPLHCAICHDHSADVISFLVAKHPQAASVKCKTTHFLPLQFHLMKLGIDRPDDNYDDFLASFQVLYGAFDPDGWDEDFDPNNWIATLTGILQHPKTPPSLVDWLAGKQKPDDVYVTVRLDYSKDEEVRNQTLPSYIRNLKRFVPQLKSQILLFEGGVLDGKFLGKFFSEVDIPPTLEIDFAGVELFSPFVVDLEDHQGWGHCQIEDLFLNIKPPIPKDRNNLVQSFQALPNLKYIYFSHSTWDDATLQLSPDCPFVSMDEIMELLAVPSLKLLRISLSKINDEEVSEALKTSSSTALVEFQPNNKISHPGIAYLSSMNCHGRAKISASDASLETLIGCLCSIGDSSASGGYTFDDETLALDESVWYGLLREAPGLWATADMRKRTACDLMEDCEKHKKIKT